MNNILRLSQHDLKIISHTYTLLNQSILHTFTDDVISAKDDPRVACCPPKEPVIAVGGVDCWAAVGAALEAGF